MGMDERELRKLDEKAVGESVLVLRSDIDQLYERIFSDDTVSSISLDASILGLDKTWRDLLPSFSTMKALEGVELANIFMRKPFTAEEQGSVFHIYTHFSNDINDSSASVNLVYSLDKSKVVTSADLKPGINVERVDEQENNLREALRLKMVKEVLVAIASQMFE